MHHTWPVKQTIDCYSKHLFVLLNLSFPFPFFLSFATTDNMGKRMSGIQVYVFRKILSTARLGKLCNCWFNQLGLCTLFHSQSTSHSIFYAIGLRDLWLTIEWMNEQTKGLLDNKLLPPETWFGVSTVFPFSLPSRLLPCCWIAWKPCEFFFAMSFLGACWFPCPRWVVANFQETTHHFSTGKTLSRRCVLLAMGFAKSFLFFFNFIYFVSIPGNSVGKYCLLGWICLLENCHLGGEFGFPQ